MSANLIDFGWERFSTSRAINSLLKMCAPVRLRDIRWVFRKKETEMRPNFKQIAQRVTKRSMPSHILHIHTVYPQNKQKQQQQNKWEKGDIFWRTYILN